MFDKYDDVIEYIAKSDTKDMFGYGSKIGVNKNVRFVGMETVQINKANSISIEDRYIFHCPFSVSEGDTFKKNDKQMLVKRVLECRDIFGTTVFWRVEVV